MATKDNGLCSFVTLDTPDQQLENQFLLPGVFFRSMDLRRIVCQSDITSVEEPDKYNFGNRVREGKCVREAR